MEELYRLACLGITFLLGWLCVALAAAGIIALVRRFDLWRGPR